MTHTPPPDPALLAYIVEDDAIVRHDLRGMLEEMGWRVVEYGSAEAFLAGEHRDGACLLLDVDLPGIGGLDLLRDLRARGRLIPAIVITGANRVEVAVAALKAGASDFLAKPLGPTALATALKRVAVQAADAGAAGAQRSAAAARLSRLTARERQIMDLVMEGHPNKNIAADLGLSQRTVENHRASVMRKAKVKSLPALTRLVVAATMADRPAEAAAPPAVAPIAAAMMPADMAAGQEGDQFERFFDRFPLAVIIATMMEPEQIVSANPAFEQLAGLALADVAGRPWDSLRGQSEQPSAGLALGTAISTTTDYAGTFRIELRGGAGPVVEVYSNIIADDAGGPAHRLAALVEVASHDAPGREAFEQALREKDTQLQEIQHRVKNNLQLITALVRIEARNARGRVDTVPFDRLAGRITALQILYGLLSTFNKSDEIDLGIYLSEIVSAVMRAHAVEGISLDLKVDSYPVSVNVALPIGMVANELLTNALKHAFVGRSGGTITLRSQADFAGCSVTIADDGVGLPEGMGWPKQGKLGELIVRSLRQNANADLEVDSRPGEGTRTRITFTRGDAAPRFDRDVVDAIRAPHAASGGG